MRIGIDARQISHAKRHGLRTYVENLVLSLSKCDRKNEYIIYLDGKDPFNLDDLGPNFTLKILPWKIRYISTLLNDHIILPFHIIRDNIDLIHYPAYPANFLFRTKAVITVHDAIPFFALRTPIKKLGIINTILTWYGVFSIKISSKKSLRVITISKKSRSDLTELAGIASKKLNVIYLAASDCFKLIDNKSDINMIREKYDLGDKYILGFAHKNGIRISEAYLNLPRKIRSEYKLGLICLSNDFPVEIRKIIRRQNGEGRIICIPPVSENDLILLYSAASLFVFPSFYEGFGLPVLEAMQCGCPVICSNRGSIPEVAGDAAVYIHELDNTPFCVHELSDKIQSILKDKSLRSRLIKKGFKQAENFSWEKTAMETLNVYKRVYGL